MGIRVETVGDQRGDSRGSGRIQLGIREETVGDQGGNSWGSQWIPLENFFAEI